MIFFILCSELFAPQQIIIFLFFSFYSFSQEIVNTNFQTKIKIDGVSAVVGDYVILESDVDKTLIDLQSQGVSTQNITSINKSIQSHTSSSDINKILSKISNEGLKTSFKSSLVFGVKLFGRTEFMTSVIFDGSEENIGNIVQVKITGSNQNS